MQISETGKPNSRLPVSGSLALMNTQSTGRGFTLIEVLVVLVIVATIVSMALLSIGLVSDDRELQTERTRLASLIDTVRDEAVLQGREFGVEFMRSGYRFVEFDALTGQWGEIPGDDLFRQRDLPDGMEIELYVDDKRVALPETPRDFGKPDERGMNLSVNRYTPHVYVFASGEATAYELRLRRRAADQELVMRGDVFGDIEFGETEGS